MEKFGIFELLDALSAATAREIPPEEESPQKGTDENLSPSVRDAAFSAPVYGVFPPEAGGSSAAAKPAPEGASPEPPPKAPPAPKPSPEADALRGFYARHDAVAKKAKGK